MAYVVSDNLRNEIVSYTSFYTYPVQNILS